MFCKNRKVAGIVLIAIGVLTIAVFMPCRAWFLLIGAALIVLGIILVRN